MRDYACIYYCVRSVSSSNLCTAAAAAATTVAVAAAPCTHSVFVLGSLNAFAFCFRSRGVVCIVDRCRCFLKSLGFRLVLLLFLLLSFVVYTFHFSLFYSRLLLSLLLFDSSMACRSGCIHACGRFLFLSLHSLFSPLTSKFAS